MVTMNAYRTRDKRLGNNQGPWRESEASLFSTYGAGDVLMEKSLTGLELISAKAPV
jgi:hypothetical protein